MPRQVTHLITVEHATQRGEGTRGANGRFDKRYGGSINDMVAYLTAKYGILPMYTRAIVHDIFRYVEMEALAGRGSITIPRFGRFERRQVDTGAAGLRTVLKLERKDAKQTYIDFEDEEWVDE